MQFSGTTGDVVSGPTAVVTWASTFTLLRQKKKTIREPLVYMATFVD